MKKLIRAIALLVAVTLITGCTTGSGNPTSTPTVNPTQDAAGGGTGIYTPIGTDKVIPDGAPDKEYLEAANAFAAAMLGQMEEGWTGVISPLSLQLALGLLANGADAETQTHMLEALCLRLGIDSANMNAAKLLRQLTAIVDSSSKNNATKLQISNALITNGYDNFLTAFESVAADYYGASLGNLDFSDSEKALQTINAWVGEQTNGLVENLFSELSPDTAMVLLNTIYFNAQWQSAFTAHKTDSTFNGLSGTSEVTMLTASGTYKYGSFDCGDMVLVPYSGGEYYMAIVLPKEGFTPAQAMAELMGHWDECTDSGVYITMPAVDLTTNLDVMSILSGLGLADLAEGNAAFNQLLDGSSILIDQIVHATHLSVTAEGTEAAAGTGISGIKDVALVDAIDFNCNRPYAMSIVHAETGSVMFVSAVNDLIIETIGD